MSQKNGLKLSKSTTCAKARGGENRISHERAQLLVTSDSHELRRLPRQERARFTVAAILEAAALVIDEVGWSRASTNRIAERAGVSIGSLYQYFPNKEAILASLYEKHHREVNGVVGETMAVLGDPSVPISTVLRKLFDDLVRLHREDPVVARVLSTEVPIRPAGTEDGDNTGHEHQVLLGLLAARPDVGAGDLEAASRILEITVEALTRWMVHEAPADADLEAFVNESVAMLSGYLRGSPRSG
jgi:AcrR family transcriptional regulator